MDQNPLPFLKPMPPLVSVAGDAPADNVPSDRPPLLTGVAGVTLNEVLGFVAADLTISTTQRRDRLCAMRRLALMIGKDPRLISARPDAMRVLFKSVVPAAHGIKETRWANIRSRVLAALAQAGIRVMRGRSTTRLSPAWLDFQAGLSTQAARIGLSRFMRFCTDKAFEPDQVDDAVFERFYQVLRTESPVARPHAVHRTACIQWNLAVPLVPALAAKVVTVSRNAQLYSLPWSDFPASFVADAEAFLNRSNSSSGPFTDEYVRPQRRSTIELRRGQIRQMASLLVASGYPTAEITGLAALADPVRARTILEAAHVSQAMRAMASDRDWTWILRAANRLRAVAVPVRQKRTRMQELQALAELGIRLMRQAEATNDSFEVRRAALYRDGLIIALMAHRPLRLRSFSAITLGQHLTQRETKWWLCFAATDMKTKQAMEMAFPLALVSHLKRYLDYHRPLLSEVRSRPRSLRPATSALWIATGGTMMCAAAIGAQIGKHTAAAFGAPINPHLFRDCAATSIAIQDPEHVRTIIPILGHATIATSERHYNQARTLEASRRYQQTLMGIRHDMRQGKGRDVEIQRIKRSRAYGRVGLRPLLVGAAVRTPD